MKNDEVEEWASSIFNPPKHRFKKMSPSRKNQKLDDLRDDDIAIKLSLSQDENNVVDSWNYPRASPKSFQDGLFTSGTFDFSLPATPPRAGADLHDLVDLASPPDIRKQFGLDAHKMSSPVNCIATLSPKKEGGMFQEIQGRIQHLSPDQTLYHVASNSDDGSPCRPRAWGLQDEQVNADKDDSHCFNPFNPPQSDLRKSRISDSTKAISVTEPITPSQVHIYQTVSNETSSPAMHHQYLKTANFTPETKLSTPNAVTNVSNSDSTIQYNTPSTWSQAPLPPFVSHKGESAHPELLPRPPQPNRLRGWSPVPQFLAPFNTGLMSNSFHPDRAHSSIIDVDHIWSRNQELLRMFQSRFGHCNVPDGYGVGTEYEGLHSWCQDQRVEYQKMCRGESTTMTPTRRNILMELGVAGVGDDIRKKQRSSSLSARASWSKWMEKLTEYRAEHGNADVPLKYEPCPSLGTFVNRQRTELRKMEAGKASSLTPARIQDLNDLGFSWALRESHVSFGDRYEELKQFKDTNGESCLVFVVSALHHSLFCITDYYNV